MTRETYLSKLLNKIGKDIIIASTGKISRELYSLRLERNEEPNDFYMMGSMGCAIGIGLGVAVNTKKKVHVITGDGAVLMKLGSVATALAQVQSNLNIIVLNNNCHESTGGQKTNFWAAQEWLAKHIKVVDVGIRTRKNLERIGIEPNEITRRFKEKVCS